MRCECTQITKMEPNLCVMLSQYRLIEVEGNDAEKYLQGQLTCDVAKLAVGEQTLTCHCDPKGKMSSLFRLYRHAPSQFFIVIHQSLLPEALAQLKKYAVFSKVTFTEHQTPIYGLGSGEIVEKICNTATVLSITTAQPRYLVWGDVALTSNADEKCWELADIQDGIPVLLKANQFELIPQAVNLQLLDNAISFTKGCYIGQETVARAKYRGANKRAMFTLVGQASDDIDLPATAQAVEMQIGENWKSTGTVLHAVVYQNKLWVQVVLNKETEEQARFRFGHVELKVCPLPYLLTE